MSIESDLYKLPKDILIKLLVNVRSDVEKKNVEIKECRKKHEKELEKYKLLQLACKEYFKDRKIDSIEIVECSTPGCEAYSVMDPYYWVGVHKNCEDMEQYVCNKHYVCNNHYKNLERFPPNQCPFCNQ